MSVSDKVSALIVNESWGSAYSDGIPSINRMIAKVLRDFEINNIYSTVVRSNADDEKEAKFFKVQLKYPQPEKRRFKNLLRNDSIPNADFIYLHDHFYPNLKQLAGEVKIIFAYSLTTAEEARKLQKDLFDHAELYFINVWDPDSITPEMISGDDRELSTRFQELSGFHVGEIPLESLKKPHVLDIGKNAHVYFKSEYEGCQSIRLCNVQPKFGHVSKCYVKQDIDMTFKIATLLPSRKSSRLNLMVKVLKRVADSHEGKLTIVLKIIGDICEKEEEILEELSSSKIEVVPKRCYTQIQLEKELLHSHLVLCNADTHISDPSVSLALSLGVPSLLPESPDFKYMIQKYLAPYDEYLLVNMTDENAFHEMLKKKFDSYETAVSTAKDISVHISTKWSNNEPCEELYEALERHVARIPRVGRGKQESGSTRDAPTHSPGKADESDDLPRSSMNDLQSDAAAKPVLAGDQHSPNNIEMEKDQTTFRRTAEILQITLAVQSGTPGNGQDMARVEEQLYDTREQAVAHEAIRRELEDVEPDTEVSSAEEGCIRYNVKCKTSKALQGLWRRYQSGELRKIVQDTLITPDVLRKVNAICIRMRVVIDYNEYRQALQRLTSREKIEKGKETSVEAQETINGSKRPAKTSDADRLSILENQNKEQHGEIETLKTILTNQKEKMELLIWKHTKDMTEISRELHGLKSEKTALEAERGKETLTEAQETVNEGKRPAKTSDTDRTSILENQNKQQRVEIETLNTISDKQKETMKLLIEKHTKEMTEISKMIHILKSEKTVFEDFVCDAIGMMTIGGYGSNPGQFNHPSGIAVDHNGDLIIADKSNRRVQVIDWYGKCKWKNVFDKYKGLFRPRDVALSSEGMYIIVTDHGKMNVLAFDQISKNISSFGEDIDPYGITLSKDGSVLVNDRQNDCVKKYTKDGEKLASFGSSGREKGQFNFPWSVAVNSKNQMLVSDQNNHRVQLFSSDGEYLKSLGSKGSGPGQLEYPFGIDVDKNDSVYVCDYGNRRIVQFSADGEFLQNIGEGKVAPRYVAVYKDAGPLRVAVSDWEKHCIKVFFVKTKSSNE